MAITTALTFSAVQAQPEVADSELQEQPQDAGGLFEDDSPDPRSQIEIADDAVPLTLGGTVQMPPSEDPASHVFTLTIEKPSVVTLLVDCPSRHELSVFSPTGAKVQAINDLVSEPGFGPDAIFLGQGVSTLHQPLAPSMYRIEEPGVYAIHLSILRPTEGATAVGASLFQIPEADLPQPPNAAQAGPNNPAPGAIANPEATPAQASRWTEASCVANQQWIDFEFTAEQDQVYTAIVRTEADSDVAIVICHWPEKRGNEPRPITHTDDDPLERYGSESGAFEAKAGKRYLIRLQNLSQAATSAHLYLLPADLSEQE